MPQVPAPSLLLTTLVHSESPNLGAFRSLCTGIEEDDRVKKLYANVLRQLTILHRAMPTAANGN